MAMCMEFTVALEIGFHHFPLLLLLHTKSNENKIRMFCGWRRTICWLIFKDIEYKGHIHFRSVLL